MADTEKMLELAIKELVKHYICCLHTYCVGYYPNIERPICEDCWRKYLEQKARDKNG